MDLRTNEECFAIVKMARQRLNSMPTCKASDGTLKGYEREFNRLVGNNEPCDANKLWSTACDTTSRRTYYRRLAALKYGIRTHLENLLRTQDHLQRIHGKTTDWHSLIDDLTDLLQLADIVDASRGECPIKTPKRRHSKRQDLRGLPIDWREQISQRLEGSKYHLAYLVATLTGCRPDELQRGIRIQAHGDEIRFTIIGSKVKDFQGQPTRTIAYLTTSDHPLVNELLKKIDVYSYGEKFVAVSSKVNFTSAIRRVGRLLWPRKQSEITPYCLRHAAASDFKRHLPADLVSIAMGHAVDATASMYGQSQQSRGSGGLQPSSIQGARPIKHTRSSTPGRRDTDSPRSL